MLRINMAFQKITLGVNKALTPQLKIITPLTTELFLHQVQDGRTLSAAAKALSLTATQLREMIDKHISEHELKKAMRLGAEVLVDEAGEMLKMADSKEDIEKAKAIAQHYRWLASKLNKVQYGETTKVEQAVAPSYEFNIHLAPPMQEQPKLVASSPNGRSLLNGN